MYEFKIITSMVITDYRGRFLLGKRSLKEDVFPGLWSIPGGKVEHGPSTSNVLEKNVIKEVLEEIGVESVVDDYIESHSDGKGKIYIIFLGHIISGVPRPLEDTEEVGWFGFEEINPDVLCPSVHDILRLARK